MALLYMLNIFINIFGKGTLLFRTIVQGLMGACMALGQPPAGPQMVSEPHGLAMGLENIHNWFILGGMDISSAGMAST